jgi:GAF domain-containing protein
VRRDGSGFWADSVITALWDESGKLRGFAMVTRDISSWKEAEEVQRRHTEYQASIIKVQADIALVELDPESLMRLVVERVLSLTKASGASVELLNEGQKLSFAGARGVHSSHVGLQLDFHSNLSGLCMRADQVLTCGDAYRDQRLDVDAAKRAGVRSIVVAPVKDEQRIIGVLRVVSSRAHAFDEQHSGTLQLLAGFLGAATECSIIGTDLHGTRTLFNEGAECSGTGRTS